MRIVLALLLTSGVVAAEPRLYVAAEGGQGGALGSNLVAAVETRVALDATFGIHALVTAGRSLTFGADIGYRMHQARLGGQAERCLSVACGFVALDLGYHEESARCAGHDCSDAKVRREAGLVGAARAGLRIGGRRVGFIIAGDLYRAAGAGTGHSLTFGIAIGGGRVPR